MRNNAGLIAALTVLVAVFGVSSLPRKGDSGPASENARPAASREAKKPSSADNGASDACAELAKRIKPFVASPEVWSLVESSCPQAATVAVATTTAVSPKLKILIATAPNPVSTHLPLFFDRMVEVILQAAQDEYYSYDSSWFPWDVPSDYVLFDDQRSAESYRSLLQKQPGVITFRRSVGHVDSGESPYSEGLLVFVVAEQPTGGIDLDEFQNSLAWVKSLGALTHERNLRILGPAFSGSLPSLQKVLESLDSSGKPDSFAKMDAIHIFSGTVSSEESYRWFHDWMGQTHRGSFDTAMEGDDLQVKRFTDYIYSQGYDKNLIAILSEDETAFGTFGGGHDVPIHLYYPRDIATLRSAYERQSIFSSARPQASNAPTTSLHSDLSEPASSQHDTVRSYGGQLTPLTQESLLVSIANILREKHIQFVVLRSTNSLDQVFLTQFLRRAYPQARVVIDGSDLLFRRGGQGVSIRGVMTLSSYPLLTWQQDWTTSQSSGAYRVFQEDVSEGTYIAARQLIGGPNGSRIPIVDYSPPAWALSRSQQAPQHPATWLSVVGHRNLWPVAVLTTDANRAISAALPVPTDGNPAPLQIVGSLQFLLFAGIAWCVLHWAWCSQASTAPSTSFFRKAHFAPMPKPQHRVLIAASSLVVACFAVASLSSTGFLEWSWRGAIVTGWAALLCLMAVYATYRNFQLPGTYSYSFRGPETGTWRLYVAGAAGVVFLLFCLLYVNLVCGGRLTIANKIPAYWRSAHLLSGVSGLTPQLVLLSGMYLWCWFALRGLALFGDDRPLLPQEVDLPASGRILPRSAMPMYSQEGAAEPVEQTAVPLGKCHLVIIAVCIPLTIGILGLALENVMFRTLGERPYGILMFFWISLCISLVAADMVQLWVTWRRLRALLVFLDELRLRRALAALRGMACGTIWSTGANTLEERYRVISRQIESLHHLKNCVESCRMDDLPPRDRDLLLESIRECDQAFHELAGWYVSMTRLPNHNIAPLTKFQQELAATAASVLKILLIPAWQKEKDSLISDRKIADGNEPIRKVLLAGHVPPQVQAGEEFFVLPYVAFIQNMLGRIRTLVLGSLCLYVATTLAASSYPFDPLPVIGGIFLGLFALAGGISILVFGQMHRDATLSHITDTNPGELGLHFWVQLLTFGAGPLLGMLTTLFPSITDFVASWLQPSVQAVK